MSFLTPLYILGVLAVAAPIVFHLIRRSPKGEVPFGSLMFLAPTPPRLTRRSRLDNWLLLLLRAAALCLLAAAFARPFLREAAILNLGDEETRRIAILIDTSASMRRGDLWAKAKAAAEAAIGACRPGDQIAVLAFDATTRPLLGFAESSTLDPARRRAVALAAIRGLAPTWRPTHLGQALIDAVAAIEDVGDSRKNPARMPRRIILISDLQQGGRVEALGGFEWPKDVEIEIKALAAPPANAAPQWLSGPAEGVAAAGAKDDLRVGVSNQPGSNREAFELSWVDGDGKPVGPSLAAYVPPGQSRVVRVPRPAGNPARSLRLKGDVEPFDNTLFLAPEPRADASVVYLGAEIADDPAGLLYYLQRVFEETPRRAVLVDPRPASAPWKFDLAKAPALVVLATETTAENVALLKNYMAGGGTVLFVAPAGRSATLAGLAGSGGAIEAAPVEGDAMLTEIAFDHPVFAPLSGPQFNDFTKIHFWKHRRIDASQIGESRVLARFEGGDPAVIEKASGKGRLVVFASGWSPADGQLARSSKFVPLMAGFLESRDAGPAEAASHAVGDRVAVGAGARVVRKPDGTTEAPAGGAFSGTDQPGLYEVVGAGGPRVFAVNLDPSESKTAPLEVERLEQLGVKLASPSREAIDRERLRQMQNAELEGRQKLWRGLILAAVGVLILETWLAGRLSRPRPARAEASAA